MPRTTDSVAFDLESRVALNTREDLICEVQSGLSKRPRSLASWIFHDACGSRLFEFITQLPEYYPTRTERSILANSADTILAQVRVNKSEPVRLIELGAGTASKNCVLLEALGRIQSETLYVPIDASSDALEIAGKKINAFLPDVCVEPVVANYVMHLPRLPIFGNVLVCCSQPEANVILDL